MPEPFLETLRKEISETQQRREKLGILKITFVTALLGFGGIRIGDIVRVYQILYLAPLVATFFDFLIQGEQFSIRRMGAFLRLHSPSEVERAYENFVRRNRDVFFKVGSSGFTLLSYLAALVLLRNAKGFISSFEWLWFSIILTIFIVSLLYGSRRLYKLDIADSLGADITIPKAKSAGI